MDFITHGLISFLMGQSFGTHYAVFAILMGVFPDFDVILMPLAYKFNNLTLYHRGGVHSFFVLGIVNLIGAFIINSIFPGNILLYFGIGFLASSMHLFCDILTTFPLTPFWPFYKKKMKLDITEAVNILGIVFSATAGFILYRTYYKAPSPSFPFYFVLFSTILVVFILFQVISKISLSHKFKEVEGLRSLPSMVPFYWKVIGRQIDAQEVKIKYTKYIFFSRRSPKFLECHIATTPTEPPITSDAQAVQFSYQLPEVQRHLWRSQIPLYCIEKITNAWKIYWFSAEMSMFNWAFARMIELDPSGNYKEYSKAFHMKKCNVIA